MRVPSLASLLENLIGSGIRCTGCLVVNTLQLLTCQIVPEIPKYTSESAIDTQITLVFLALQNCPFPHVGGVERGTFRSCVNNVRARGFMRCAREGENVLRAVEWRVVEC